MAVAGFGEGELDVTAKENSLVITGSKAKPEEGPQEDPQEHMVKYLHRGIATRAFERRFHLADHLKVTGAKTENALLSVDLLLELPTPPLPRSIPLTPTRQPHATATQ